MQGHPAPLISGTIRSRGPDPRAPLPLRTCSFPNRPRVHLTSARSRRAGLIHVQPSVGYQPGCCIAAVAGANFWGRFHEVRRDLPKNAAIPAPRTVGSAAPPGPAPRAGSSHRPVTPPPGWLIRRTRPRAGSPGTGQIGQQRLRPAQPGPLRCVPYHRAEERQRQRARHPTTGWLNDAASASPARRPSGSVAFREPQPLLGSARNPAERIVRTSSADPVAGMNLTQAPHGIRQATQGLLAFTDRARSSWRRQTSETRNHLRRQHEARQDEETPGPGAIVA